MKKYLFIACLMALTACHKGRTYCPNDIEPQQIDIVRFDKALMNVRPESVREDIQVLYDEYPTFMPLWVEDLLGIPATDTAYLAQQLPAFLNDTLYGFKQTNAREQEVFADVHDIEKILSKAFSRIAYLYPETEIPDFYLFISGFQTPIYFEEDLIGIGAEM